MRFAWIFLLLGLFGAPQEPPADLVLVNGTVVTMEPERPRAEAVAVRGDRIAFVGDTETARSLVGPETEVIDLGGKVLLPGLIDSHVHFLSGSLSLEKVDLARIDLAEAQERLSRRAQESSGSDWIEGRGWSYSIVEGRLPHRKDLDSIVPDRPVYLVAYDGHTAWVNSRALELAGITEDTPQPSFGEIVRDESGEPSGLLKEGPAMDLVRKHIPEPSREEKKKALLAGLEHAARLGLTSIQNARGTPEEIELYAELEREGRLTLRAVTALRMNPDLTAEDYAAYEALREKYRAGKVRAGRVKAYIDGVVETHTAAMLAPYADDPSTSGSPSMSQKELDRLVADFDRRKFQIYIHAIGDRGVRMALDAYQKAQRVNSPWDRRHRIEHIEVISPQDIPRFAALGILAGIQATHFFRQPGPPTGVWQTNVGAERLAFAFAWQSLAEAGARITFGSDWPVATLDPMVGLRNAVARFDQQLAPERALRAFTVDAAYASYDENELGSLREGKLADLIVLSRDVLTIPPKEIAETEVLLTVFDGRTVHRARSF